MNFDKVQRAMGECAELVRERLRRACALRHERDKLEHCIEMQEKVAGWLPERIEKAFRWLGFVQGVLWALDVADLDTLKAMNRPTGEDMRLYVAGGSSERLEVARPMIERLRAEGVEVTYDWTRSEGYDRAMNETELREQAALDLDGVRTANVVWVMVPEKPSEGAHGGMCAALALGKRVIVSGSHAKRSIFALLACKHYETHEETFAALIEAQHQQLRADRAATTANDEPEILSAAPGDLRSNEQILAGDERAGDP